MTAGQPLRGFVGQSMSGTRQRGLRIRGLPVYVTGTASGSVTARAKCTALIALWGGGASGVVGSDGGGGSAACYARVQLQAGDVISYVSAAGGAASGNDGGDSVVTLPRGRVLTAGGGKASAGAGLGGLGGQATGGDINRSGGAGGTSATNGNPGQGPGGGAGGATGSARGGGGGAAGLSDVLATDFIGGDGTPGSGSAAGNTPGGGTGADAAIAGAGGPGRVVIVIVSAPN